MLYFYKFILWLVRFDLVIARSTGRDPGNINQLIKEMREYEKLIFWIEVSKETSKA